MSMRRLGAPDWMYGCLGVAEGIIESNHAEGDAVELLKGCEFRIFVQNDRPRSYGYVRIGYPPRYNISINKSIGRHTPENSVLVTVVLVHQLLHVIHAEDTGHSTIRPLEERLARKAGYADLLKKLRTDAHEDGMAFCG